MTEPGARGEIGRGTIGGATLGSSGLAASRLGLGLAALGRPGYINIGHALDLAGGLDVGAMERQARSVLDAALASGVRYFDAARSYGRAEAFLAAWLADRGVEPGSVGVGSKWGYTYTADWQVEAERHEVKDHSKATLDRQAAESASLLGPWIGLYQVHSATIESGILDDRATLEALASLRRDRGWTIGLSTSGPAQGATIARALGVAVDGERLFGAVQATWNLLEPSAGPMLAEAHAAGLGVIVKEALANGRLTSRNDAADFAPARARLDREARSLGTTIDALALAAALARPWADVVLSGAGTVEQLQSNLESLKVARDEPSLAALADLAEGPADYWSSRSRLAWN